MHALLNATRGKRLQYGLKHCVTTTIHRCQGDTLHHLVTQISSSNSEYHIWDKAHVVGYPQSAMNCLI